MSARGFRTGTAVTFSNANNVNTHCATQFFEGEFNFTLAPGATAQHTFTKPGIYAVRVEAGDLGTKGGLVCDEHSRVLREDGSVIEGLYATGNSTGIVAGATLGVAADIDILHVPYKGTPQALTDLVGGQVDFMFTDFTSGMPFVKSGRLHAMAVSTAERSQLVPDLPAMREVGVEGAAHLLGALYRSLAA